MFDKVGTKNTPAQTYCMAVSLSYFIYDCLYCIVTFEFDAVVHHIFTIGGLTSGVVNQKSGVELVGCLFLMEVSNPSLHLRSLLREMRMKDSMFSTLNDLLFAGLFLVCRLVLGPPLVYKTLTCKKQRFAGKNRCVWNFSGERVVGLEDHKDVHQQGEEVVRDRDEEEEESVK